MFSGLQKLVQNIYIVGNFCVSPNHREKSILFNIIEHFFK